MDDNEILDAELIPAPKSRYSNTLRKTTFGIEVLFWVIFSFGLLFKKESWPNADELMIFSIMALSLLYPTMLHVLANAQNIGNILFSICIGLIICLLMMAGLFKIESWPFSGEMYEMGATLGFIALCINGLLLFINLKQKAAAIFYSRVLIRLGIIFLLFGGYKVLFQLI